MKKVKAASKENLIKIINRTVDENGLFCDLNHINVSGLTDLSNLFEDSEFNGDISKWDVSNVTDVGGMFTGCSFNGDISNWNTSKVKHMEWMFFGSKFNGNLSKWDTSNVIDMQHLFHDSEFNGDVSRWNVSKVLEMSNMFYGSPFNGDISQWTIKPNCILHYVFSKAHFSPIGILGLLNNEYVLSDEVEWAAQFHEYKPVIQGLGLEGMGAARELYLLLKKDLDKNVIIDVKHNDFNM